MLSSTDVRSTNITVVHVVSKLMATIGRSASGINFNVDSGHSSLPDKNDDDADILVNDDALFGTIYISLKLIQMMFSVTSFLPHSHGYNGMGPLHKA